MSISYFWDSCLITIFKQYKSHQLAGWHASALKEEVISIYLLHFCLGTMNCHFFITGLNDPTTPLHISLSLVLLIPYFLFFLLASCFREAHRVFTICILPCFTTAQSPSNAFYKAEHDLDMSFHNVTFASSPMCCRVPKPEIAKNSVSDQQWPDSGSQCAVVPAMDAAWHLTQINASFWQSKEKKKRCSHYNR